MTGGITLHYADDGPRDAPALVLVGSLGATLAMWEPQLTLAGGICVAVYSAVAFFACLPPHHRMMILSRVPVVGPRYRP